MSVQGKLIGLIADEDTVVGFLLAGIGEISSTKARNKNYMIVDRTTHVSDIEEFFEELVKREDIDIILINQLIADKIRHLIDAIVTVLPTILEIPSRDSPYDANKDSILRRARGLFNPHDLSLEE